MFLKEIEMQGFKSFADKTKIVFDKGVTAVVGPNGSGKSNITESLRWALGESSAKSLRGGKMPDVIFAGTQNRNPLNFAQVSVVLDNSDHFIKNASDTIRVERHIYRNGDSDYIINSKKVRLRDIHDLFMDTGLGKDSFSIISQGRVEAIFNSKAEERRSIFEEAAGVLKYKTRKKETQTRLNQTQDNLDRLEDIIYELDSQVKPLEKQANIAQQFLELEARRKQLQLDLLVEDIATAHVNHQTLDEKKEKVTSELKDYYKRRQQLEEQNQSQKTKRHQLSQTISQEQASLLEITKLISDTQRQIEIMTLESSQKETKRQEMSQSLSELEQSKLKTQAESEEIVERIGTVQSKLEKISQSIARIESELKKYTTDPDQLIEQLREEFVTLMHKEAQLSNQLTSVKSDIEQESQKSENQTNELEKTKANLTNLEKDFQMAKMALETSQKSVASLLRVYQEKNQDIVSKETAYQQMQDNLFAILDDIKSKEARKSSLEQILKNNSQFYVGVKSVLQAAQQLQGIIGAVSENLTFDTKYRTALEIALGASSQNIIVKDEAAAKRSIAFLKKNRHGRATFLPLTTIKPRQIHQNLLKTLETSPGFLGVASKLVDYDENLTNIFENLLGATAVFEHIDQANQAAKLTRFQVRIITLDGTEIRPGGSFSGGSNRQNNTTFIKPELDQLQSQIEAQKLNLKEIEEKVAKAKKELSLEKEELEKLKQNGEEARLVEQKNQLAYQQLQEKLNDVNELYDYLNQAHESSTIIDLEKQKASLENDILLINQEKEKLDKDINELKENKSNINQKLHKLRQQLSETKLEERDYLSQVKYDKTHLERVKQQLQDIDTNIEKYQLLLSQDDLEADQYDLPQLENQFEQAKTHQSHLQEMLVKYQFELEDIEAQSEDIESQIQNESQTNESLIRTQAQTESEIEQVETQLRQYARLLNEDYQMTYQEAKNEAQSIENTDQARLDLNHLVRQIKALGPVNLEAINQYKEVNDRLIFLHDQKADLDSAKSLLLNTINDMDDEVKTRFKTTFEAIRQSFKETFVQMFGGGSADLLLTEGDLLTAGVEISVQPPGKKIQSLNLMSGGEKALSALALLFAIIRVKTIPFVILDEVEAALDEANVKRFGDYLNRFDKNSQFIVVTHRKGTMAAADSIYGVTMQESGVSKLVSVKLKDQANPDLDFVRLT